MSVKPINALILIGIVFFVGSILGNLLYMNPFVAGLYADRSGHPGIKPWQEFGSLPMFIMMNVAAGAVLSVLYVVLFSLVRGRLPESPIAAGLVFGFLVVCVKAAPEAWNQHLNINYPSELVITQFVNSSISIVATGLVLGFAWMRWPVVR